MRASSLELAAKCPGSWLLGGEASDESRVSIQPARLGHAFHEIMASKITDILLSLDSVKTKYGLSEEEIEDLLRHSKKINITIPVGAKVYVEEKMDLPGMDLRGSPDFYFVTEDELVAVLTDWKSGWMDVSPPESNYQIIAYALMVIAKHPKVEKVEAMIVQPRLNDIKAFVFTRDFLEAMLSDIRIIIENAQKSAADLVLGSHCHGCFKAMKCHAFSGQVVKISKMVLPEIVFGEDKNSIQAVLKEVLPFAKAFERIIKRIDTLAKAYVDLHGTLELGGGMEYIKTLEARESINMQMALPLLRANFPNIDASLKISKTELEDLSKKVGRGFYGKLIKELESHGAIQEKPVTKYVIKKKGEQIK